jgi:hypothetical protein
VSWPRFKQGTPWIQVKNVIASDGLPGATFNPHFGNSKPDDLGSAVFQTEYHTTYMYITVFGSTNTEYVWNSQEIWAN